MLEIAKKGDRVILANGLKATVISRTESTWLREATVSIKADGGKYKTREYTFEGNAQDDSFSVVTFISGSHKKTVESLKEQIELLQTQIGDLMVLASDMETTAETPVTERLTSYDFRDGKGLVPAHRHVNPEGDEGGIVADSAIVSSSVRIGRGSVVFGTARITGNAKIVDNSRISG